MRSWRGPASAAGARRPRAATLLLVVVVVVGWLVVDGDRRAAASHTTIDLDPSAGPRGTRVAVTGSGFFPDSEVRIYFGYDGDPDDGTADDPPDDRQVGAVTATSDGQITTSFLVPSGFDAEPVFACTYNADAGRCSIIINGEPTREAEATFQHAGSAFVRLAPGQGEAGTATTATLDRFASPGACGDVAVGFDGTAVGSVTPADDDGDGDFEGTLSFTVPDRPVGRYTVTADQSGAGCDVSDTTSYEVLSFTVDPASGPAGSTVTAEGAGFEGDVVECGSVRITFDGEEVAVVDPQSDGSFTTTVAVPTRSPGPYVVEANQGRTCGVGGDIAAAEDFRVVPEPEPAPDVELAVDPARGPITTDTEVTGDGFRPDEPVTVTLGGVEVARVGGGDVTGGSFTVTVAVPEGVAGGSRRVVACQDCDGPDERAATAAFTVTARLTVDPPLGPPGRVTTATADGLPADTEVTLEWQPGIGSVRVTTDDAGRLTAPLLVLPGDVLGGRTLRARLPAADDPAATASFLVVPGVQQPPQFAGRR